MQIFYSQHIDDDSCRLDANESRHCIKVLRLKKNSPVNIIDGKGNLYEGIILSPDQGECIIKITSVIRDFGKRPYHLHIAISPLKNPERFEWFVEKSVEIGIDEITPVICRNTEKQKIKRDRINNIIISAMKQSVKAGLTTFNEVVSFKDFIETARDDKKLIAHCSESIEKKKINEVCTQGDNVTILIGPEGDFSEYEIILAMEASFKSIHLGNSRLRAETAGIVACHSVYFLNQ
jgi:16S rRNA (uracil1498-N3)-methyltransferase